MSAVPRLTCRIPSRNATVVDVTTFYEHVSPDCIKRHATRMEAAGGVCAATTGSATDTVSQHHPTGVGATPLAPPAPTRAAGHHARPPAARATERRASPAAESGSAADASGSQLQALVQVSR